MLLICILLNLEQISFHILDLYAVRTRYKLMKLGTNLGTKKAFLGSVHTGNSSLILSDKKTETERIILLN